MQKKFLIMFAIVMGLILTSFWGCTFNNEEEYFGITECDTTDITYNDLTYIFTDVCSKCHNSSTTPVDEIVMNSYEAVKASINTTWVIPAIKHEDGTAMPYNLPKLSDCDIHKIEIWVRNNMPEK